MNTSESTDSGISYGSITLPSYEAAMAMEQTGGTTSSPAVPKIVATKTQTTAGMFKLMTAGLYNVASNAISSAANTASNAVSSAANTASNAATSATNTLSSAANAISGAAANAATSATNTLSSAVNAISGAAANAATSATNTLSSAVNAVSSAAANAATSATNTLSSAVNAVSSAANTLSKSTLSNILGDAVSSAFTDTTQPPLSQFDKGVGVTQVDQRVPCVNNQGKG